MEEEEEEEDEAAEEAANLLSFSSSEEENNNDDEEMSNDNNENDNDNDNDNYNNNNNNNNNNEIGDDEFDFGFNEKNNNKIDEEMEMIGYTKRNRLFDQFGNTNFGNRKSDQSSRTRSYLNTMAISSPFSSSLPPSSSIDFPTIQFDYTLYDDEDDEDNNDNGEDNFISELNKEGNSDGKNAIEIDEESGEDIDEDEENISD